MPSFTQLFADNLEIDRELARREQGRAAGVGGLLADSIQEVSGERPATAAAPKAAADMLPAASSAALPAASPAQLTMPPLLYFAADLRCIVIAWATEPPQSLWVRFCSGERPEDAAAWLLTPTTFARVLHQATRLDAAFSRGEYPREKIEVVARRMAPIMRHASAWLDAADCRAAIERTEREGVGWMGRLPEPDLHVRACPW